MIWEIYTIFLEINTFFDQSTLPKFVKRVICRSRIHKLLQSLKKAKKLEYYTWSDIYMLLNLIDEGDTDYNKDYYTFSIQEENDDISQIELMFNPKEESMDIRITIKYGGNSIRSVLLGLKDTNESRGTSDITRSALVDMNDIMRVYIDRLADDLHERSERIYTS